MASPHEPTVLDPNPSNSPQSTIEEAREAIAKENLPAKLNQLVASATQQYSLKNYNAAAECYSEAAEVQDQLNGEMSAENADLLYQYGRCLYHVAVANSDVLGGKVAGTSEEPKRKKRKVAVKQNGEGSSGGVVGEALKDGEQKLAAEVVEAPVDDKTGTTEAKAEDSTPAAKPYFQITGDENWTDSEDEEVDDAAAAADAEVEEEEDDFAIAYEILDVARVLLSRKLDAIRAEAQDSGQDINEQEARQIKERLADTHDLQAEISLENERFADAIKDSRDALGLKMQLYPEESSLIAEAHFKLSLALELASVTSTTGVEGEEKVGHVDEELRKEAVTEMESAIASCKARITKEQTALATITDPAKRSEQQKSITDVKEMITDMNQRLVDLRNPAVNLSGITGPAGAPDGSDPLKGVLGAMLGESKAEQQKRITEATAGANDLSGLVKHRKKPKPKPATVEDVAVADAAVVEGKGKRKAEAEVEVESEKVNGNGNGKRVKFADDGGMT